jgi:hypothetical protein
MEVIMSTPALPATRRRSHRRWLVALVATAIMVVSGSGLVAFAQTGSGASEGPVFVPADAPIYLEARLDLPDGQAEALASFMSAFPGFADEGSFQLKVDEALDAFVSDATEGAVTVSELQAFLTGEVGLAITELTPEAMEADEPPMIIGGRISDRAAADAFVSEMLDGATPEAYGSASLYTTPDASLAVADEWILISPDLALVQASVDVLDGSVPSLAADEGFSTAFARVPSGHLGAVYVDLQSLGSLIELGLAEGMSGGMTDDMEVFGSPMAIEDILAQLPDDMVAYLAAGEDRLTLEAFITASDAMAALPVGESALAGLFPTETQLYVETRDLGSIVGGVLGAIMASMDEEATAEMAPFEDMLGVPLPELLDFVADAGIGAGLSSDGLWLGVAAEVTDAAAAAERVDRLLSIITILGATEEAGLSVDTATVGDTEVTTITLPVDSESMGLPFDIGQTISVALTDTELLLGTGDFVTNALTQDASASLGASAPYTDALADDTTNSGVIYANIGSLLAELDPLLSMMMPEWAEVAPYATALDRLIAVGTADEEVITARLTVIVAGAE